MNLIMVNSLTIWLKWKGMMIGERVYVVHSVWPSSNLTVNIRHFVLQVLLKTIKKIKIRYQRRGNSAHEEQRQMKGFVQRTISRVFNFYHFGQTETKRIQEGNFTEKQ